MHCALKPGALGLERQMAGVVAIEVLFDDGVEMALRLAPQGVAHIHVLSGNA